MQAAIIEIDNQDMLTHYNRIAKSILGERLVLNRPFDYCRVFNLAKLIENDALNTLDATKSQIVDITVADIKEPEVNTFYGTKRDDIIIVLQKQYYLLQRVTEQARTIFILQPIDYLKRRLSKNSVVSSQAFDIFATKSQAMKKLIAQAKAFSLQREPLLISGETGSGKDLLANACHQYSSRGDQVFLGLNCAAMPDEVVESELYGHAAGAYPGATESKKGFFEQANGGSVLLDGIDEMSFQMQTKLLRFINDGYFRRVGDDNEVYVDVRIICATKVDLALLVEQGKFRKDLYYRLNVLALHLPSLQERYDDLEQLTYIFVTEFANKQGIHPPKINADVIDYLSRYAWPGNVRQLKNVLYCALAQLVGSVLTVNDIVLPLPSSSQLSWTDNIENKTLDEMTRQFEKGILSHLYDKYPSSRKLAKRLGISHTAVANKLRDYGVGR